MAPPTHTHTHTRLTQDKRAWQTVGARCEFSWMQTRYKDCAAKVEDREQQKQKQKQNGVDGASGRLTLFNRAVHQVLTGIDSLGGT